MIVIDASVIVKLAKKEEGTNQAIALKERHIRGENCGTFFVILRSS